MLHVSALSRVITLGHRIWRLRPQNLLILTLIVVSLDAARLPRALHEAVALSVHREADFFSMIPDPQTPHREWMHIKKALPSLLLRRPSRQVRIILIVSIPVKLLRRVLQKPYPLLRSAVMATKMALP